MKAIHRVWLAAGLMAAAANASVAPQLPKAELAVTRGLEPTKTPVVQRGAPGSWR